MPRSRKPRHALRRLQLNTPMMRETHRRLALELRMAVEALAGAPSPETYNALSKMLAALRAAGLQGAALDDATTTLNQICDRYELSGAVTTEEHEAAALRSTAALIELALPKLPVNVFVRAVAQVETYCATAGA